MTYITDSSKGVTDAIFNRIKLVPSSMTQEKLPQIESQLLNVTTPVII